MAGPGWTVEPLSSRWSSWGRTAAATSSAEKKMLMAYKVLAHIGMAYIYYCSSCGLYSYGQYDYIQDEVLEVEQPRRHRQLSKKKWSCQKKVKLSKKSEAVKKKVMFGRGLVPRCHVAHVARRTLRAVHCMQHVARCVLHVARCMLRAVRITILNLWMDVTAVGRTDTWQKQLRLIQLSDCPIVQ